MHPHCMDVCTTCTTVTIFPNTSVGDDSYSYFKKIVDLHTISSTVGTLSFLAIGHTFFREALSINLVTFDKPLRKLIFADLLEATNGFHNDSRIGSGGVGDIYKAQLKDNSVVAIKKLIHVSEQGDRELMAEMETIGKIKHRNPAPLLGYCKVG